MGNEIAKAGYDMEQAPSGACGPKLAWLVYDAVHRKTKEQVRCLSSLLCAVACLQLAAIVITCS